MIAKVEIEVEISSVEGTDHSINHELETHAAVLKTTREKFDKFCAHHLLSREVVVKTVWTLLLHTYQSTSSVKFCQIDSETNNISKLHVQLGEHQTLLGLCKQLESSTSDIDVSTTPYGTAVIVGEVGGYDERSTIKSPKSCGVGSDLSAFELVAAVRVESDQIKLTLLFNEGRVNRSSVLGYWYTFEQILETLIQDCSQTVHQANFLSNHDRDQLIAWNAPIPEEPEDLTICDEFTKHVRARPEAPAVYAWDGEMNYGELDKISSQVAGELWAIGVTSEDIVPFCMEKTKWALVVALAILKTGAALVPMDPAWPQQRTVTILDATQAEIVVCSPDTSLSFGGLPVRVFELSGPTVEAMKEPIRLPPGPSTTDVAFILFSSGSTGVPKGMVREHGTACIASIAHAKAMHIDSNSRVLQFSNHVFDVAMLDFFTTLIAGGCVCIPSEFDRQNDLAGFVRRSRASWALLTPTVASILDPTTVPTLRDMTTGGEAVSSELLSKWLGHCRVGINYGSAEVDVTHARDVADKKEPSNVGKRLSSCVTYIVDPENVNKILPIGAVGELLISGPTLARSYLRNPEKTAASFIEAPVDWYCKGSEGAIRPWMTRAYRMGDLLQQQYDGSFKFVGRRDFQVKIHGQKVELGEIEAQLSTHPQIYRCAVVYPRSGSLTERLVAVVEPRGITLDARRRGNTASKTALKLGVEDIKQYLSERVPSYMLPQVTIVASPMPLTATMKVDRTKLKSWIVEDDPILASSHTLASISTALKGSELQSDDVTAIEVSTLIADLVAVRSTQIWTAVQGHDNLLSDIGVDSVQTMRLSNTLLKKFGRKVPVETLTDKQLTVRQLAKIIDMKHDTHSESSSGVMTGEKLKTKLEEALARVRVRSAANGAPSRTANINGRQDRRKLVCNVFVTGVTGYLGNQILRALLEHTATDTVHILVRSSDTSQAQARVAAAALAANWSIEPYSDRIKIWLGDLSQPQLGLQDSDWIQLAQTGTDGAQIDSIIHCGAVVDWTKSYDALEAANVSSTVELLNLACKSCCTSRFIYISGGQYFQPGSDQDRLDELFAEAAAGNGYAQTKFVAEQLVNKIRLQLNLVGDDLDVSRVKPAYLIGSTQDGLANIDDYLWRLVSAAVELKAYNGDEAQQWLLVADSSHVARIIVELVNAGSVTAVGGVANSGICVKVLDGISLDRFWSIVSEETRCRLQSVTGIEWMTRVKEAMERYDQHALWPLLEAFDKNGGLLSNMKLPATVMQKTLMGTQGTSVEQAIRRNVRYLMDVGFLPGPPS